MYKPLRSFIFSAVKIDPAEALYCRMVLGSEAKTAFARRIGMGTVTGVELDDGRRVRLKWWDGTRSEARLRECRRIHHALHSTGYPSPTPLGELVGSEYGSAAGWMAAEHWEERGTVGDTRQRPVRREIARALWALVERAKPLVDSTSLGGAWFTSLPSGRAYPQMLFNQGPFAASAEGAEWIDQIALFARGCAPPTSGSKVIGHFDFRAEHLLFDEEGQLSMVYDWDSLHLELDTVMVGAAAHAFTVDQTAERRHVPTLEEVLAFIDDYENARGERFTQEEHRTVHASALYSLSYSARWSHFQSTTQPSLAGEGWDGDFRPLLRQLHPLLKNR